MTRQFTLLGVLFLTMVPPVQGQTFNDQGFVSELVTTLPVFSPVGLAWAPDGRMFIWQKNGVVKVFRNGTLLSTPFLDFSSKVNTFNDNGMWGLAFHPGFATNGYVYLTYVFEPTGNPNDTNPKTGRLVRVRADPANPDRMLAGSEITILGAVTNLPSAPGADCFPDNAGAHAVGTIRFAADGAMFVGNGDGGDAAFADPNAFRAQDFNYYGGKILRINDDGTAPLDNPFYDGFNSIRSKIWAYGLRNPYRFCLNPATSEPFIGDVGWNTWEEIIQGTKGGNFGWPCFEGAGPQPTFQGLFGQCAQITSVLPPLFTYDHATVGSCVIGGPFFTGTQYPQQFQGNLFFGDYAGNWIRRVQFDGEGNATNFPYFATGVDSPVSLEEGPDGLLYYVSFNSGQVRRVRFNGPVAVASAAPMVGLPGQTILP
jgi:glucose/arabinose dehydrogenase